MWSLIQVLSLCQGFLISHFPVLLLLFFLISAGVISKDSSEFGGITFALNNTSAFSNVTLRTFNATEPASDLFKQGNILIRSDEELTIETSAL